jgi:hypothetical protein
MHARGLRHLGKGEIPHAIDPQLAPSGVLGLVGLTENKLTQVERAVSWSRFIEVRRPGTAYSMPEARQALANGVFELVIAPIPARPKPPLSTYPLTTTTTIPS